jgi:chromatin remodeling complex protein RSC6
VFSLGKSLTPAYDFVHLLVTAGTVAAEIRSTNDSKFVQRRIEMAKKKAKKSGGKKRKPNAAFMKAMTPSSTLAAVIGSSAMPRTEVTKKIWGYIKRNGLQDKKNKRMINSDEKLKPVFGGKSQVSMFEMTKLVSKHLK